MKSQISLSGISAPIVYEEENTIYRVWDHALTWMWDGYEGYVRVIKSLGIKIYKASLSRSSKIGNTRREGRLVMGHQSAFSC